MTERTSVVASNKLLRLVILLLFLGIIVNPNVWSIAGFSVPELSINLDFILRLLCFKEHIGIYNTIKGVFIASIVFFIYNNITYKNGPVEKLYRNSKDWESILPTIFHQYLHILVQCVLWGAVFVFGLLFDLLPDGLYMKGLMLGSFIAIVNILPICFKIWIEATYPNKLIVIELAKGIICGFIIGFTLVSFIWYLPYGEELTSYTVIDLLRYMLSEIGIDKFLDSVGEAAGINNLLEIIEKFTGGVSGAAQNAANAVVNTGNTVVNIGKKVIGLF